MRACAVLPLLTLRAYVVSPLLTLRAYVVLPLWANRCRADQISIRRRESQILSQLVLPRVGQRRLPPKQRQ